MTPSDNTYVFDSESPAEMARLANQDRSLTKGMGGCFAGLLENEIANIHNVVDLGCGPGGWVLDVAHANPTIEIEGVDISRIMVDYANARARSEVVDNASFGIMDIKQPLDFPDASFDLVNARFLFAVLKREDWSPFLAECFRILRPGGLLRLTEPIDLAANSSPAGMRIAAMVSQVLYQGGYAFATDGQSIGLTYMLPHLLRKTGYEHTRQLGHALDLSADTDNWGNGYNNVRVAGYQSLPLFSKLGLITEEEGLALYNQMLIEYRDEEFCSVWHYMTALGQKPETGL